MQPSHGIRGDVLDDLARRLDRADHPARFAEPDRGVVRVAPLEDLAVARALDRDLAFEFVLAAVPAFGDGVAPDARREADRP